jgi:hypothetical protein
MLLPELKFRQGRQHERVIRTRVEIFGARAMSSLVIRLGGGFVTLSVTIFGFFSEVVGDTSKY